MRIIINLGNFGEEKKIGRALGFRRLMDFLFWFYFFRIIAPNLPEFEKLENLAVATIVPTDSKIKVHVKHDSPALLSEWYQIQVHINNDDKMTLYHSSLEVKLQTGLDDQAIEQSSKEFFLNGDCSCASFPLGGSQHVLNMAG